MKTVLVLSCFLLVACNQSDPEPTIRLDRGWDHSYAANWCKEQTHKCIPMEDELEVSRFELDFATAFAADAGCSGVHLLGAREPVPITLDQWSLSFEFIPGENLQRWTIVRGTDWKHGGNGEGNAASVAHSVCAFVKHTGGRVD